MNSHGYRCQLHLFAADSLWWSLCLLRLHSVSVPANRCNGVGTSLSAPRDRVWPGVVTATQDLGRSSNLEARRMRQPVIPVKWLWTWSCGFTQSVWVCVGERGGASPCSFFLFRRHWSIPMAVVEDSRRYSSVVSDMAPRPHSLEAADASFYEEKQRALFCISAILQQPHYLSRWCRNISGSFGYMSFKFWVKAFELKLIIQN